MASICDTCSNPAKVPSICVVTKNKYGRDVPNWICGECMLKIQEKRTERKHGLVASLQEGE